MARVTYLLCSLLLLSRWLEHIRNTQLCSQFKLQGVLATYWFSAGIEDFSAADVWTFMDFMNFCRIGINRDWWWSLYWSSLLQQHCNTKTRMHKSQNIGNAIALRTAKLESREVMRQVRRGFFFRLWFSTSEGSGCKVQFTLAQKNVNIWDLGRTWG